ncbi:MAG: MerR family transcriptional regulator [Acidimicrobiia bacterium]|nr:MerR family transcriptional regulator [Acidimicrobiia bacterium]
MYRIGEFSKICRVPVSALRYYSDLGLLPPESIDPESGYRYYSAGQLPRLNRILALKDLGLSLEEISAILDEDLPAGELRGMLRLKRAEIGQRVSEEQARLARVENRLRMIESEDRMPDQEIVLKELEDVPVVSIREVLSNPQDVGMLIADGYSALMPAGIMPIGACFSIYHDPEFDPTALDVEIAYPVAETVTDVPDTPGGRSFERRVVRGGRAAVTIHQGPYDMIDQVYTRIGKWISDHELQIAGEPQEAYLTAPDDPGGPVTEIRFPVA